MLSYRHSFHAGNHGDVLKHATLALLLEALKKKDAPFAYLETHAGAGRYDLRAESAEKTGEYREGIARIWSRLEAAPAVLAPYLSSIQASNPNGALRYYPGSPRVARHLLRPQDRMVLMELHGSDFPLLKQEFVGDGQVSVHHRDGYEGLRALLPPKEKRGLLLMDPSYEVKAEFGAVVEALLAAHRRWNAGVIAVWYPLLAGPHIADFKQRLRNSGLRKLLCAELSVRPAGIGMYGSGMLILNPPWQLDQTLSELLPWLRNVLSSDGAAAVEWLVPE